jgi:hypothetical protein
VTHVVGIEHFGAEVREDFRHLRFAAADAAGQSHEIGHGQ